MPFPQPDEYLPLGYHYQVNTYLNTFKCDVLNQLGGATRNVKTKWTLPSCFVPPKSIWETSGLKSRHDRQGRGGSGGQEFQPGSQARTLTVKWEPFQGEMTLC